MVEHTYVPEILRMRRVPELSRSSKSAGSSSYRIFQQDHPLKMSPGGASCLKSGLVIPRIM